MPTVLRTRGFRFHFYSDEYNEPPHIHVETPEGECKFWLVPIRLARNKGISPLILRRIEKLVYRHSELFLERSHEFHH